MHYLIDGYNLLFRISDDFDELSVQRQQIIVELNHKVQALKLNATLVFDAHYQAGDATRTHFNFLEILFSGEGETADDLILRLIQREEHPSHFTIVTSDTKLAWKGRRIGAKTETVDHFLSTLNKRYATIVRRQKETKIIPRELSRPQAPPENPKKVPKPSTTASPEECFDYYLYLFEKSATSKSKKKKDVSDMERWLKEFEERVDRDF